VKITELEALAKAATPGPWETVTGRTAVGRPFAVVVSNNVEICDEPSVDVPLSNKAFLDGNAYYIAAANPETILSMISLLREMGEALETADKYLYPDDMHDEDVVQLKSVFEKYKETT
jgi:hypothetical protein